MTIAAKAGDHMSAGTAMPKPMLTWPDQMISIQNTALKASVNSKYRQVALLGLSRMTLFWLFLPDGIGCGAMT